MALSWLELGFSFQIDVPCQKHALIDVVVERLDAYTKFRMICQNYIGGLPLVYQRTDGLVNGVQILF